MSRIIKPGDAQFSEYELQLNARKQAMYSMSTTWKQFLEATAESCINTEVGKKLTGGELDDSMIRLLWTGGKQIEFEQQQQLAQFKANDQTPPFEEEHIPLAVAEVITQLAGVIQQNPTVVGSANWRAFVLCVQLGVLKITSSATEETPIEEVIEEALIDKRGMCLDNDEEYFSIVTALAARLRAREEAMKITPGETVNP